MKEPESELKAFSVIRIPNMKNKSDPLQKLAPQLDHSAINGESTPIPLDYLIDDHKLLNRLQSIGIFNTSDLWIPIIFDLVFGGQSKIELIHSFLRTVGLRISPYIASDYKLDYSVRLETGESPLTDLETAPFSADYMIIQMEITIRDIKIYISVMCKPEIMEMEATDIEYKDLVDQLKAGVIRFDYETLPKNLEWREILKVEKYPLIASLLEVLDTKTKGYSDPLRSKEVFVRRNGLISGKIETLEEIAVDKNLTRERIRQIEDKTNKFLWARIAKNSFLLSCRKVLKEQIWANLLFDNQILEEEELTKFLRIYIDFGDYHPAQATALLSKYANLFVQRNRDGNNVWFVTSTKHDYDNFCKIFLLVAGIELIQPESGTAFNRDLFNDIRLISKYHNENDIRNIRATAKSIIGSSKVMRFDHFITSLVKKCKLDVRIFENCSQGQFESEYISGGCNASICNVSGVSVLPCAEYENIVFGRWVNYDLTKTEEKIARAILYAGVDQVDGSFGSDHFNKLRKGISLSEIVKYLQSCIGTSMAEHAVEAVCRRSPGVFIYTGSNKWGLTGAGSALEKRECLYHRVSLATILCHPFLSESHVYA